MPDKIQLLSLEEVQQWKANLGDGSDEAVQNPHVHGLRRALVTIDALAINSMEHYEAQKKYGWMLQWLEENKYINAAEFIEDENPMKRDIACAVFGLCVAELQQEAEESNQ